MIRNLVLIVILLLSFALNAQTGSKNTKQMQKTGLNVEFGPNLGTTHVDTKAIINFYVHITAIITNDSTIPIHLQLALAEEYDFPDYCSDDKYKVFLLPEELTPDTATVYNNIVNGQHDFLNAPLQNSCVLNKTLNPGEFCVITIGTLTPQPSNCAPVPRAVFSHDTESLYEACDSEINQKICT